MRISFVRATLAAAMVFGGIGFMGGCGTKSEETGAQDQLTAHVGKYDPAPAGITRPRVGVPPFKVTGKNNKAEGESMDDLAADQMTTLLDLSERFKMIERAQLEQLLKEQNLEGIVKPGEMAKPGQVRGVDYLLIGKVTDLSVKAEKTSKGFGLGQIGGLINVGAFDYKDKSSKITTECGVDIRLVDPTTGELMTSNFSQYKKTDSISAFGVDILGASAEADADLSIDENNKGKILRLALDEALRKSLPKIDRFLMSLPKKEASVPAAPVTPATPAGNTGAPAVVAPAAKKFCAECGKELATGAKFCAGCGAKAN